MNKEVRNRLIQIIAGAVFLGIAVWVEKNMNLPMWQVLLVYLVPYLISGGDVLKEALEKLFSGELLDEDFLMSIATIGALGIGFLPNTETQFAEAVFVMLFFKVGELFEEIAEGRSKKAIKDLMDIRPDYANIERSGKLVKVNPDDVTINDIIIIKPGEKVPMDGIITEGKTSLNTVALTGESIPRDVVEGDMINSGCVNLTGTIKVRVTNKFSDSTASKIIELVENASESKSKSEKFITKFANYYTPIVVGVAVGLAVIPPLFTNEFMLNFSTWLARALTFLVVSCPCALVISVPLAFFGGIGGASKNGILIKGSNYIEKLSKLKTLVFDKTGTLTEGVFEVTAVHHKKYDEEKLLHLAAHVERYSSHPIAISLKNAYKHEDDDCEVKDVEEFAGNGVKAKVNKDTVYVGNDKLMKEIGIDYKPCKKAGTIAHVAMNDEYLGHIVIADKIKEDSKGAVEEFKKNKIKTIMLSGDRESIAKSVAEELQIDEWYAELLPNQKVEKLKKALDEKEKNTYVAFVGDGINDAPVLARADVGIAMGMIGSDASVEAADVVLMEDKVSKIIKAIKIAKRTLMIAKENIVFAIIVKLIVLILASVGLAPMWLAVFADVGVTVIAVLNSARTLLIAK